MRVPVSPILLASCAAAFVACSHNPQREAPAPQPGAAPAAEAQPGQASLDGDWALTLQVQARSTDGAIRLRRAPDGRYNGFMQLEGANQSYAVRSVRMEGMHFIIVVDTDDGEATIEGNLRGFTRFDALYIARHTQGQIRATKQ